MSKAQPKPAMKPATKASDRKCPLNNFTPCMGDKCAWWCKSPLGKECAIASIGYLDCTLQALCQLQGAQPATENGEE